MKRIPIDQHTMWLMMTLRHAAVVVLQARLASTQEAIRTSSPPVSVMKTKQTLPCCGYEVDTATDIERTHATPKEGDVTICLSCGAWLRFDKNLICWPFKAEDLLDLTDDQLAKMRRATAIIRKRGPIGK